MMNNNFTMMTHLGVMAPHRSANNNEENMKKGSISRTTAEHPESLFSMATYDYLDYSTSITSSSAQRQQHQRQNERQVPSMTIPGSICSSGIFDPVISNEYKDLSLGEILDLSSDILLFSGDGLDDDNIGSGSNNLNDLLEPVPLSTVFEPSSPELQAMECEAVVAPSSCAALPTEAIIAPEEILERSPEIQPCAAPEPLPTISAPLPSNDADATSSLPSNKKRPRTEEAGEEQQMSRRFRPYQAGQWAEKFDELCAFRAKTGHCLVPHTYKENLPLARWVKRQRYQYKLMMTKQGGKGGMVATFGSTMTAERVRALEAIGFVWDSQEASWGDRLDELRAFKAQFRHCNVPSNYAQNPRLATWVKCQRRQCKLLRQQKPSNMTAERIAELEKLGFEWDLRNSWGNNTNNN